VRRVPRWGGPVGAGTPGGVEPLGLGGDESETQRPQENEQRGERSRHLSVRGDLWAWGLFCSLPATPPRPPRHNPTLPPRLPTLQGSARAS
jgi:hypothetical protein